MQNLPIENVSVRENIRSSSLFLIVAFAIILSKCAPSYVQLSSAVILGYALTRCFKKVGFLIALALLGSTFFFIDCTFWNCLFLSCIGISFLLVSLEAKEKQETFDAGQDAMATLQERCKTLEKQLQTSAKEKEKLTKSYADLQHSQQTIQTELTNLKASKDETLVQLQYQITEQQMQLDEKCTMLEKARQEFLALQKEQEEKRQEPIEPINSEDPVQIIELQNINAQLKKQFEEKSETLTLTRQELFRVENAYLALQKEWEEKKVEPCEENLALQTDLKNLEEECKDLEEQAHCLQDVISTLLTPKTRKIK